MENESVGLIAELLLQGEVEHYSTMKTATVNQGTASSAQNPGSINTVSTDAGGKGNTLSAPALSSLQKMEQDGDEESEDKQPLTHQTEDESQTTLVYPEWLHQLHEHAQEKEIHLIFSNLDITQFESGKYLPSFFEWNERTSGPTTPAYHGCHISPYLFPDHVSSVLVYVVLNLASRRGYFSVTRAACYTNSFAYARVWPAIKSNLYHWRQSDSLPAPSILILVSEPSVNEVRGQTSKFITTIISQDRSDAAAQILPSLFPLLTSEQYVTATKTPKSKRRVSHEDYPGISTCDFIISPLPKYTMVVMQTSASFGRIISGRNDISLITVLTAATDAAVKYMSQHITKIII